MTRKINASGEVVIPSDLRDELGIKKGTEVEVTKYGDGIIIRPKNTLNEQIDNVRSMIATINEHYNDLDSAKLVLTVAKKLEASLCAKRDKM